MIEMKVYNRRNRRQTLQIQEESRRIMFKTILIFILAGLAEIGGGYLIWQWLREGKSLTFGFLGGSLLICYGIIATFQTFSSFGRVYAAYGGIFIILSVLWGWGIDRKTPDLYDWLGAAICLIGASVIIWGPRNG